MTKQKLFSHFDSKYFVSCWQNISIAKKLSIVLGTMTTLVVLELFVLHVSMRNLSALRSFVAGEGNWSKAQKNAFYSFQRYSITKDSEDYKIILNNLAVPEGDRLAKIYITQETPDLVRARENMVKGKIHPADMDPVIELLRGYRWTSYMKNALAYWEQGDQLVEEFRRLAEEYHQLVISGKGNTRQARDVVAAVNVLNSQLTAREQIFSQILGEGSRWMEKFVFLVLFIMVITVEGIGITLTALISKNISKGLNNINELAVEFGQGNFKRRLEVETGDEIGKLSASVNRMGSLLEKSYNDLRLSYQNLEKKIWSRTAELATKSDENVRLYVQAKEALKTRDEFLSIANHELRTPLTALNLQLHLLDRALNADQINVDNAKAMVARSNRLLKKLMSLQDVLMDLTYIQRGKFDLKIEKCDLVTIAQDCLSQLSNEAARRNTTIHFDGPTAVFGSFDSIRAGQVITNLLSNALKYGDGTEVEFKILTDAEKALVIVKDHGPGITPEKQLKIFERFERASTDHSISGLGLGLYITKQIIEAHGGSIMVESGKGAGSTFVAEFPLS